MIQDEKHRGYARRLQIECVILLLKFNKVLRDPTMNSSVSLLISLRAAKKDIESANLHIQGGMMSKKDDEIEDYQARVEQTGLGTFKERLVKLGYSLSQEEFGRAFTAFKELADKKKVKLEQTGVLSERAIKLIDSTLRWAGKMDCKKCYEAFLAGQQDQSLKPLNDEELREAIAMIVGADHYTNLDWDDYTEHVKNIYRTLADQIKPLIRARIQAAELRGIDSGVTAYESTCEALIQEAEDKAVKVGKDAIARHFIKLFQELLEDKE